jgi:alpha-L-fucosidase
MERRTTSSIEWEKAQRPDARRDPRLDWWRRAGFGAFIHWGLYALPDRWPDRPARSAWWTQEWLMQVKRISRTEYARLAADFNPRHFDPDAWLDAFESAGQRYVILTAKHHDGFCLFRSDYTRYNTVHATPFGRDVVAETAAACARRRLPFGLYYSQTQDWYHPDGHGNDWDFDPARQNFARYVEEYVKPQIGELLTRYGPIAVVWFDTPKVMTAEQSRSLVDLVHRLQPACLVNGRVGNGMGDYATTRDNQYLTGPVDMDWECPATMNDTWGYRASDQHWKSAAELLANLRDVRSKGGNYLLNVGPDEEGRIPDASRAILAELGQRWQANGCEETSH